MLLLKWAWEITLGVGKANLQFFSGSDLNLSQRRTPGFLLLLFTPGLRISQRHYCTSSPDSLKYSPFTYLGSGGGGDESSSGSWGDPLSVTVAC